ncbi:hypothetical protein FHR81_002544 [Actinoalloteichus hoggarensis]|uniref:Uncharacterized protein n=1 Tax=Actinoalloteichus hoggarensis TaxID=1470176 RepID=A0A221VXB9_9PSEU|nr:hypothetical protein [Actinoalloteichus hoggarensis]ASO18148.1 hypothetical protein AHOG_02420 [Actinoalloteichus hoggarensis]MBB5921504.1 hypothetical protein [Actinoalloteichus hoggarensis]
MTSRFDPEAWKTPQVRAAEAQMAGSMGKARELLKQLETLRPPPPVSISEDDVRQLAEAAKKSDAPAELRQLAQKVDGGALSWRDVLEGRAYDDPDVRRAMTAQLGEARELFQQFQEGFTLDEVIDARRAAEQAQEDEDGGGTFLR